ncbi:MAG TPA: hypothetical protein DD624_08925 [Alphaproteobacteria bacterium]|nr:hypothetical protein [Alphaproteobacteria bacterium]
MVVFENGKIKIGKGLPFFGILMIIAGVWTWFHPDSILLAMAIYLGIVFLAGGIGYLYSFIRSRSGAWLALGLLDILIGLVLVTNLGVTALSLPIFLAVWALGVGVIQTAFAFEMKDAGFYSWKWTLVNGILGIVFGLLIIAHPVIGALTISLMLGSYLVLFGVFSLLEYFTMKRMTEV